MGPIPIQGAGRPLLEPRTPRVLLTLRSDTERSTCSFHPGAGRRLGALQESPDLSFLSPVTRQTSQDRVEFTGTRSVKRRDPEAEGRQFRYFTFDPLDFCET